MKPRNRLVALNVALAMTLGVVGASHLVSAQVGTDRARGEYTMVSGRTNSGGAHAVYILDSTNQEMIALRWDQSKQTMTGIGYRSLSQDGQSNPGR